MSNKDKLRVVSVQIRDILGVKELAMEPNGVTVLSGHNGSGKSSVIEAIKAAVNKGNLATIQRVGEEGEEIKPEVVLVLENDDEHYRVEKKGKKTRVRRRVGDTAGFEDVPSPSRWLSGLFDGKTSNPIKFLNADNKDRIIMLLGALDVQLDRDKLWNAMDIPKSDIVAIPEGLHPLQELALIREGVFNERTGVNRDAKQKADSAEQTRRAAPAVLPDGHEEEIEALDKKISDEDKAIAERMEQAKSKCDLGCSEVTSGAKEKSIEEMQRHDAWAAKKRAEVEALIDEDRKEMNAEIKKYEDKRDSLKEAFEKERDETIDQCFADQKKLESDRTKLTELREAAKAAIKAKTLHEQAEQFDKDSEDLKKRSNKLTAAINALDAYRRSLTENLPIQGVEVTETEIKVDGILYDQLNTQKQMEIAVQIACLRAKNQRLPIVWIDGAECLDSDNFEIMKKLLEDADVIPFVGRVEDHGLEF